MKKQLIFVFILISVSLVFSGYLSAVKLFTNVCAFSESCPYFLGYPACWYGFAMYLVMFIATGACILGKLIPRLALKIDIGISFVGILFAGRFFIQEFLQSKITGALGLSTCTYGLIFYALIFILSLLVLKNLRNK